MKKKLIYAKQYIFLYENHEKPVKPIKNSSNAKLSPPRGPAAQFNGRIPANGRGGIQFFILSIFCRLLPEFHIKNVLFYTDYILKCFFVIYKFRFWSKTATHITLKNRNKSPAKQKKRDSAGAYLGTFLFNKKKLGPLGPL